MVTMMSSIKMRLFSMVNKLFYSFFPLYRLLYFTYKKLSDRENIRLINNHVRPGMKVLEVGANIGFYTLHLSGLVGGKGIIYAFEPDKDNFKFLKRLMKNRGNVRLVNAACGEKSGVTYLYKSEKMNVDHQVYESGELRQKVEIMMMSVDDYFKGEKNDIGLVKIDVQGYDCFVFKGMKETLARSSDTLIIGELWPYGLKRAGSSTDEYLSELRRGRFDVRILSKNNISDFSLYAEDHDFYLNFAARRKSKAKQKEQAGQ
jgi:FkbM family methyltransferase